MPRPRTSPDDSGAKPRKTTPRKTTTYVLLQLRANLWAEIGRIAAHGQEHAIRLALPTANIDESESGAPLPVVLVAVPERSWKPQRVETEVHHTVTLSPF
jgi:hypothetical protein